MLGHAGVPVVVSEQLELKSILYHIVLSRQCTLHIHCPNIKLIVAVQVVCTNPLAQQSLLLHELICEAVAAHQESQELDPDSQVRV